MNNLWNRSVGPFDEAAAQRHRHMGLLDCNGDVNADAVNFLAHLCAGLFFDALCDSYVEMQTVSRICQAFCKSENVEAQRVVLMICSEYGAKYNYGGSNATDYQWQALPYGVSSNASVGCMEKVRFPGLVGSIGGSGIESNITNPIQQEPQIPSTSYQSSAYTSVDGMERKDGSIGTLKIPSLNINMKVWEGETNTSMAKGLGHYSSTSGWDGNIGVCGHNRGAKYTIGSIKNLKDGDTITYTTVYGTRTYEVVTVETIASSDWSYLQATSDNRVTITTCLANQPSKRVCVQAVEVK